MRQGLPRVPKDRIAVLIGTKGASAKAIREACGCEDLFINSETGDVEVHWGNASRPCKGDETTGRNQGYWPRMSPKAAIRLFDDRHFFEMVDLRDFVGKRSNRQRQIAPG